jgi:hypothetical protein
MRKRKSFPFEAEVPDSYDIFRKSAAFAQLPSITTSTAFMDLEITSDSWE